MLQHFDFSGSIVKWLSALFANLFVFVGVHRAVAEIHLVKMVVFSSDRYVCFPGFLLFFDQRITKIASHRS